MAERDSLMSKKLEIIKNFRLFDDTFFIRCFDGSSECIELVLSIILDRHDLFVISVETEKFIANIMDHSVILDIFAKDGNGKIYDIEIQKSESGADRKRARFYSSMIDSDQLAKGMRFSEIPESFVIFITESDVIGHGFPVYCIERYIMNTGEPFGDESHIVYVNGGFMDDSPIGWLMHDFSCSNPDKMHYKILKDRVKFFKESKEGIDTMCKAMEDFRNDGVREGENRKATEVALRLFKSEKYKYTAEEISYISGLDLNTVKSLQKEIS